MYIRKTNMNPARWNIPTPAEKEARKILRDIREERESIARFGMEISLQNIEHQLDFADVYAQVHLFGPHGQFVGETARRRRNQCMHEKAALSMKLRTYRRSQDFLRDTAAERFDEPIWRTDAVDPRTRARRDVEMHMLAANDWVL